LLAGGQTPPRRAVVSLIVVFTVSKKSSTKFALCYRACRSYCIKEWHARKSLAAHRRSRRRMGRAPLSRADGGGRVSDRLRIPSQRSGLKHSLPFCHLISMSWISDPLDRNRSHLLLILSVDPRSSGCG
jgi:hypothetical protein